MALRVKNPINPIAGFRPSSNLFFLAVLFSFSLLVGCGSTLDLASSWKSPGVVPDSSAGEWKTPLTELKDTQVFIGAQNDAEFLYLRLLVPGEQFRRQVLSSGLTVWFEPVDGKKFGILYPTGGLVEQDLEILGPEKSDRQILSTLEVPGIKVHTGNYQGSGVYELRVPLVVSKEHPYAVGVAATSIVDVSFESGKERTPTRGGDPGIGTGEGRGRMPGGGGGYGGGRRGGGFGGGRSGGGRGSGAGSGGTRSEPLDFKARLHIAAQPSGIASP